MKWFVTQSLGLALLAFGLGALFHRLLWRKTVGVSTSTDVDVQRFGGASGAAVAGAGTGATAAGATVASTAELDACRSTVASLEQRLVTAAKDHEAALAGAQREFDNRLAAIRSEHDATMARVNEEHHAQIQGFAGSHDSAVSDAASQHAAEIAALSAGHATALDQLRAELDGRHAALAAQHADLQQRHDALQTLVAQPATSDTAAAVDAGSAGDTVHDDLTVIEGIGPAMSKALHADGIHTFAQLAAADEARLRSAVEQAGLRFAPSIPTWSKQAAYLAAGDQAGFTAYTDYLVAGVDPASLTSEAGNDGAYGQAHVQQLAAAEVDPGSDAAFEGPDVSADDLTRIEGIGPKISQILQAGGVRTFRRLAAMTEDKLKSIVAAGGVSFTPSAGTWAAQAAFLRDGDEAGFQALADRLVGGRDEGK